MTKIEKVGSFESKITVYVVVCWVLAACGGLMFGYDIGISGAKCLHVLSHSFIIPILFYFYELSLGNLKRAFEDDGIIQFQSLDVFQFVSMILQ